MFPRQQIVRDINLHVQTLVFHLGCLSWFWVIQRYDRIRQRTMLGADRVIAAKLDVGCLLAAPSKLNSGWIVARDRSPRNRTWNATNSLRAAWSEIKGAAAFQT